MQKQVKKIAKISLVLLAVCLIASCTRKPVDPRDPYEKFNRVMFDLNNSLDHILFRPVAKVYIAVTPPPLRAGIANFFDNIGEITTFPNDILQGKFRYALVDLTRFVVNSTVGIGGLFDVASHAGLPRHYEDFGLTLAYYSDNKESPYLVLPVIGPTTGRDLAGMGGDTLTSPWLYLRPNWLSYSLVGLKYLNIRAAFMAGNKLMDSAFDPYAFLRDAYLQRREKLIATNNHDFNPNAKHQEQQYQSLTEIATEGDDKKQNH